MVTKTQDGERIRDVDKVMVAAAILGLDKLLPFIWRAIIYHQL